MLSIEMNNEQLSPLGKYIKAQMCMKRTSAGRPWSIRELARRARLAPSGLSAIMRGQATPETATLKKLAKALGVTVSDLLAAGELHEESQYPGLDPTAAYVARRLTELPPYFRELAVDAVGPVLDSFRRAAHAEPANGERGESIQAPYSITNKSAQPEEPGATRVTIEISTATAEWLQQHLPQTDEENDEDQMGKKKDEKEGFADALRDAPVELLKELAKAIEDAIKKPQKIEAS